MTLLQALLKNAQLPHTGGVFAPKKQQQATPTIAVDDMLNPNIVTVADEIDALRAAARAAQINKMSDRATRGVTGWAIEETDTFGDKWAGNYGWVNRLYIELPHDTPLNAVVKQAKAALGLTGVKCDRIDMGDGVALSPRNNTVVFINPEY